MVGIDQKRKEQKQKIILHTSLHLAATPVKLQKHLDSK
jgi:hypothetical protein